MATTTSSENQERDRLKRAIHAEIDRLPERHRIALVLCDLEGLTPVEAAASCQQSEAGIGELLTKARMRLRRRLNRRGFPLAHGSLVALLRREAMTNVPEALTFSTTRAALAILDGRRGTGSISPKALRLSRQALSTRAETWGRTSSAPPENLNRTRTVGRRPILLTRRGSQDSERETQR